MEYKEIKAAGLRLAELMAKAPPAPDVRIDRQKLIDRGGIVEPTVADRKAWQDYSLDALLLIETWRDALLADLGRLAVTTNEGGYLLLTCDESVRHAEIEGFKIAGRALAKAQSIVNAVDDGRLSIAGRTDKTNALMRLGALRGQVKPAAAIVGVEHCGPSAPSTGSDVPAGGSQWA